MGYMDKIVRQRGGHNKDMIMKADYMTYNDFQRLLNGLKRDKQYMWEFYCRIGFRSAMRSSDVLSLTWDQLLNKNRLVKKEQKTGKVRSIVLGPETRKEILEAYVKMGKPNPAQLVFYNPNTGKNFSREYVNKLMKVWKFKYKLQLGRFSTHTLRKTFGRYLYDTSENKTDALVKLNHILNHRDIETTKAYICITDDEIDDFMLRIHLD